MKIVDVKRFDIKGPVLIETARFNDSRGFFMESFRQSDFDKIIGYRIPFLQDNITFSKKNVWRGLHWQIVDHMDKLLQCVQGRFYDVIVDIRKNSPTFGQWMYVELSGDDNKLFLAPRGFAHGTLAIEDDTIVHYRCSGEHCPEGERCLRINDDILKTFQKSINDLIITDKDKNAKTFEEYLATDPESFF